MGQLVAKVFDELTCVNFIAMVAYFLSLVTTILVMLVFHHAQPALLYIVPYILIASAGCALYKGEMTELLEFQVEDSLIDEGADDFSLPEFVPDFIKNMLGAKKEKSE